MKKNPPLGCFSFSAMIAFVITLILTGIFAVTGGSAMFSPGELNQHGDETLGGVTSHNEIGSDCTACHTAPWATEMMQDRCLSCHNEIKLEVTSEATLHGALLLHNPELTCRDCHPDHRGADAPLTEMVPATFPHELVGFSLASHQIKTDGAAFDCADCHTQGITAFAQNTCSECHQELDAGFTQAHISAYDEDCLACHDGVESYGANFDHNQTGFPLTGEHAEESCVECHQNARSIEDFENTPEDCAGCHLKDDAHEQKFGTNCAICHTSAGWEPATFDHNLSNFPLEGKHLDAECEDCHTTDNPQDASVDCYSCHVKDDAHIGRFGEDCALCHTAEGWEPAHFEHDLVIATTECITCHLLDDEHSGQYGTDCAACHSTDAWEPATFDHGLSGFPLTGAHTSTACESCHVSGEFDGLSSDCVSCHADPAYHLGAFGTDCAACHTTAAWSPAEYNKSHTFPLNHGESGVSSCVTCHPSSFTSYTCYNCHEHSEADVRSEHIEEGISDFQNCMECHPDGREHDD